MRFTRSSQTRKTDLLLALLRQAGSGQVLVFTRTKHRAKKLADAAWTAPGFAPLPCRGTCRRTGARRPWTASAAGGCRCWSRRISPRAGSMFLRSSHVINYDMPDTADAYTHRIGRTGRMAKLGTALSLVTQDDLPMIRTIERLLGSPLERRNMAGFETSANLLERPAPATPRQQPNQRQQQQQRRPAPNRQRSYASSR